MRNGSAAIVPLLIAVMLIFWFAYFMGGSSDTLHKVNNVTNLQHLQEKLLISSVRYRNKIEMEAKEAGAPLSETELDTKVNSYVKYMMKQNRIDE